jgi:hypothetical protein
VQEDFMVFGKSFDVKDGLSKAASFLGFVLFVAAFAGVAPYFGYFIYEYSGLLVSLLLGAIPSVIVLILNVKGIIEGEAVLGFSMLSVFNTIIVLSMFGFFLVRTIFG